MDGISIICIVPLWVAMGYGLDTDLTCQDVRLTRYQHGAEGRN